MRQINVKVKDILYQVFDLKRGGGVDDTKASSEELTLYILESTTSDTQPIGIVFS
jgi:hypothetical protein